MIKKLIFILITLLFLNQNSFSDEIEQLKNLMNKKNNLTGEEYYDELSKLQDQWALDMISDTKETDNKDTELKEMKTSSAIEYALDFKCLNDCKLYKSFDMCKRICMIPSILID